ncbi:MAG: hypothetical protein ACOCZ8_03420 [Bacteroidota bacterium]
MSAFIRLLLLIELLALVPLLADAQLVIGRREPASGDCRVKPEHMKPVIQRDNLYFRNHTWEDELKFESAQLDPNRRVEIEQKGCLRHHTLINYYTHKDITPQGKNLRWFAIEAFNLFNRLFFNDPEYWNIKPYFEKELLKKLPENGMEVDFDMQVFEYTFLCFFGHRPDGSGHIQIERVQLVHEHGIKLPGIPDYKDDGWYVAPKFD